MDKKIFISYYEVEIHAGHQFESPISSSFGTKNSFIKKGRKWLQNFNFIMGKVNEFPMKINLRNIFKNFQ